MWQDKIADLINYNEFTRAIVIVAIILIMLKVSTDPRSILQSVLISALGIFGIWVVMNIDYVVYHFIK